MSSGDISFFLALQREKEWEQERKQREADAAVELLRHAARATPNHEGQRSEHDNPQENYNG